MLTVRICPWVQKFKTIMKKTKLIIIFLSIILSTLLYSQTVGIASYYANNLHGRKTASGSKYNKNELTCAHKTLKFGTRLVVKHLKTNKEVVVIVNDRGPFVRGRIIDLSAQAAKEIGIYGKGLAKVEIKKYIEDVNFEYDKMTPLYPNKIIFPKISPYEDPLELKFKNYSKSILII